MTLNYNINKMEIGMKPLVKYFFITLTFFTIFFGKANAAGINVPGDFPGNFQMDLLNGFAVLDFDPALGGSGHIHDLGLDASNNNIQFAAAAFDGIGTGLGSSALTVDPLSMIIGTGDFFGSPFTIYIDGGGSGVLNDIDGLQGHWTIDVPLFVDWNSTIFEYTGFSLSSDASYSYAALGGSMTATTGQAMDYGTGDVFLVGQATNTDLNSGLYGTRITLGLNGNDPVLQAVPIPTAIWLFGSGLLGLIGLARRKT